MTDTPHTDEGVVSAYISRLDLERDLADMKAQYSRVTEALKDELATTTKRFEFALDHQSRRAVDLERTLQRVRLEADIVGKVAEAARGQTEVAPQYACLALLKALKVWRANKETTK